MRNRNPDACDQKIHNQDVKLSSEWLEYLDIRDKLAAAIAVHYTDMAGKAAIALAETRLAASGILKPD